MVGKDGGHAMNSMAEPPLPVCSQGQRKPICEPESIFHERCTLRLTHSDRMQLGSRTGIRLAAGKVSERKKKHSDTLPATSKIPLCERRCILSKCVRSSVHLPHALGFTNGFSLSLTVIDTLQTGKGGSAMLFTACPPSCLTIKAVLKHYQRFMNVKLADLPARRSPQSPASLQQAPLRCA